jgi:hypothetical protein
MSEKAEIVGYIAEHPSPCAFEELIASSDGDRFAFLSDLMQVAPAALTAQILTLLKAKLAECSHNVVLVSQIATAMCDGPGRPIVADHISRILPLLRLADPVALGLLFFAVSHRLIYLDAAIRAGLVPPERMPKFDCFGPTKTLLKRGNFLEELSVALEQAVSIVHTVLILRTFEMIMLEPPSCVYSLRREIVSLLVKDPTRPLMEVFIEPLEFGPRIDLEFLCAHETSAIDPSNIAVRVVQLREIQASLARWRKATFHWFALEKIENKEETFMTQDLKSVKINGAEIVVGDGPPIPLWHCYLCQSGKKSKKTVVLTVVSRGKDRRQRPIALGCDTSSQLPLVFAQTHIAMAFQAKLIENQYAIVKQMLLALKE